MTETQPSPMSPWPHRWAWLLACATFPLLWVGGLITTTDAGMAVPDWPRTYGYNLFLYPWATWFFGPWDLFIEHGHRLLASGVGLLTIGATVVVWRRDRRSALRWLAVAALSLVILQGVLGGMRVVLNERYLAMAHGVTGPLFFALTVALVVLTARPRATRTRPRRWADWVLPATVYCQLMLGATLRHAPEDSDFATFASHVRYHLILAACVTGLVFVIAITARGGIRRWLASGMVVAVCVQLGLGVATWIAKYRLPDWAQSGWPRDAWESLGGPVTMAASTAGGWIETHTVTAHSALGSLLLALGVAIALICPSVSPSDTESDPS